MASELLSQPASSPLCFVPPAARMAGLCTVTRLLLSRAPARRGGDLVNPDTSLSLKTSTTRNDQSGHTELRTAPSLHQPFQVFP